MNITEFFQGLLASLNSEMASMARQTACVFEALKRANDYHEFEFGVLPETPNQDAKRNANRIPFALENSGYTGDDVTNTIIIDVRDRAGYFPRDGSVANLGSDTFQFIIVGVDGNATAPITVLPSTNYIVSTPIKEIRILELQNKPALYQLFLN